MKPPKPTPADRVTFRMPAKLRAAIEELAASDDRKLSDYIRNVLRKHVQSLPKGAK